MFILILSHHIHGSLEYAIRFLMNSIMASAILSREGSPDNSPLIHPHNPIENSQSDSEIEYQSVQMFYSTHIRNPYKVIRALPTHSTQHKGPLTDEEIRAHYKGFLNPITNREGGFEDLAALADDIKQHIEHFHSVETVHLGNANGNCVFRAEGSLQKNVVNFQTKKYLFTPQEQDDVKDCARNKKSYLTKEENPKSEFYLLEDGHNPYTKKHPRIQTSPQFNPQNLVLSPLIDVVASDHNKKYRDYRDNILGRGGKLRSEIKHSKLVRTNQQNEQSQEYIAAAYIKDQQGDVYERLDDLTAEPTRMFTVEFNFIRTALEALSIVEFFAQELGAKLVVTSENRDRRSHCTIS